MKSTIKLFNAVPIKLLGNKNASIDILSQTIKRGFLFSPEVVFNFSDTELIELIKVIEQEIGLTPEEMNSAFHKSWQKVRDASMDQLVMEQLVHYFTTYGFENLGIYNESSVYIPNEELEIPSLGKDETLNFVVIKGYTKPELKEKLLGLLNSGIALASDTITDIIDVSVFVGLTEEEITSIKNKEVKSALYDYLGLFPENPIEFLRHIIYKSTDKTLLIKNASTIEEIKSKNNLAVLKLFIEYRIKYGLENLAGIFYRFKPLFLAFKTNAQLKTIINKIRKLAVKNHKPMPEDYLNEVTAKLKKYEPLFGADLMPHLGKANVFRKIRLAYALKYRTKDVDSILYKIRNGKGYAKSFNFDNKDAAEKALEMVLHSILCDMSSNVTGKTIYIPEHITYALPATEKQFTGNLPSGTSVTVDKDMVFGIHWKNLKNYRIDLDLSLLNQTSGKIGWDSAYRTEDSSILFSGDLTSAPLPKGATELFYVKKQSTESHILLVNYYNYEKDVEVPFKIIVAKDELTRFTRNYMVDPNNVLSIAKTKINERQKILGLLVTEPEECKFYFCETNLGKSISSSSGDPFIEKSRKYLFDFYTNTISLNDCLVKAGAKIVTDKNVEFDIDLSPENLEKDSILNLLKAKNGRTK